MRAEDLDHKELLELDPDGGVIRFAAERVLLLDAVAMGILRKHLAESFGHTAARTVLTQFGFAHGWRMAEALQAQFEWDSEEDWQRAGNRIHTLEGLFRVEVGSPGALSRSGVMLAASYEAEQHLLHLGQADAPTCWTICGLMSGYLSKTVGQDVCVLEDRCLGKGDAGCHLVGRVRTEWGIERAGELAFFESKRLHESLDVSLQRATESLKVTERKLRHHRRVLTRAALDVQEPLGIVARSPPMRHAVDFARRVARIDSTVLITGESGSGKERIAQLIHDESTRAAGPFVAVNCAAVTETLLEGELFGHARGAFTGATQDRPGLFEAANTGTLLLDEVGEVSPGMQAKLLRALQEREIRRVGENKVRKLDVRVLAATNRNLAQGVAVGSFRQDLYYRLNVIELQVPPLRERREDILPLARVLLMNATVRMKRKIAGLSPAAADQLLRYEWPGNVRELENAMERAAALARGNRVELEDLPEEVRRAGAKPLVRIDAVRPLHEMEREYILAALELNGGNQTHTATQLAIGSATLYRKLKSYGVIAQNKLTAGRARRRVPPRHPAT